MNKQTGVLAKSWRLVVIQTAWGKTDPVIRNIASYSDFMEGTRLMKKRDVRSAVLMILQPIREANIAMALDTLMSK